MTLDTVTRSGGRVVKLIGDEVLFTAPGAPEAARIALEIAAACERHDLLPELRIGLAGGEVMLRDGDVFGPVVNLAARVVKTAQPGEVLATLAVADASGLPRARRGAAEGHRRADRGGSPAPALSARASARAGAGRPARCTS